MQPMETKPVPPLADLESLIAESYWLKQQSDEINDRMRQVNALIAEHATFADGKKTENFSAGNLVAKIEAKETMKWDQTKLNAARLSLGDDIFLKFFKFEWKHASKPVLEAFFAASPKNQTQPILDALTVTTTRSVSVKEKEAA